VYLSQSAMSTWPSEIIAKPDKWIIVMCDYNPIHTQAIKKGFILEEKLHIAPLTKTTKI